MEAEHHSVEDMRSHAAELYAQAQEAIKDIRSSNGMPNDEQQAEIEGWLDEAEQLENMIQVTERVEAAQTRMTSRSGRKSKPPTPGDPPTDEPYDGGPKDRVRDAGKWGFPAMGTFLQAVHSASLPGRTNDDLDQRLRARMTVTGGSYAGERIGEEGGHLVPPDFRAGILEKVNAPEQLMSRTDQMTTSSNSMVFPKDETTDWDTDGVQAYWDGEGDALTASKVKLTDSTIRLHRLTGYCIVTEELLEDAPALEGYIRRKMPRKMAFKINRSIVQGTGAGQPLGLLNSPAKVAVAKEAGPQTADTVLAVNIVKMYSRLYSECLPSSVWIANQDILPQLLQMQFQGPGTDKAIWPVYLPPGGLSSAPYGTLMGRPLLLHEACPTLGDEGDLIFTDLSQYMMLSKVGGIRQDVSMHIYFDQNLSAFRFVMRLNGMPWWGKPITPASGSANTLSCIVTLEAR